MESSNDLAKELIDMYFEEEERFPATVLVAETQPGARGRKGRWQAPGGRGLYFTFIRQARTGEPLSLIPIAVARWLRDVIKNACGVKVEAQVAQRPVRRQAEDRGHPDRGAHAGGGHLCRGRRRLERPGFPGDLGRGGRHDARGGNRPRLRAGSAAPGAARRPRRGAGGATLGGRSGRVGEGIRAPPRRPDENPA